MSSEVSSEIRLRQKRRGPRGSPCCTPSVGKITLSSQIREDGEEQGRLSAPGGRAQGLSMVVPKMSRVNIEFY